MSFTLSVPLTGDLDAIFAAIDALEPRQTELLDDRVVAWIAQKPASFPWPHTIEAAVLFDWDSQWSARQEHAVGRLVIDAHGAFGSGLHPTTQLCLERMRELSFTSCLDVGTGTGVLALAALDLGAVRAHGTDDDPRALLKATENAARNGLDMTVSEEIPLGGRFDLVVANILAASLVELAPALVRALDSKGVLILSGIRESERREVTHAFVRLGLHHRLEVSRDGWWAIELGASW